MQTQKLTSMAVQFASYGCRSYHLKAIGTSIQGLIAELLIFQSKTAWGSEQSHAWSWFWDKVGTMILLAFGDTMILL